MSEETVDFKVIESYLKTFGEGEVILSDELDYIGVAVLKLNNPRKKNAMSGKMMVELRNCIKKLENLPNYKALLLYGVGDNFCSGGDLDFARRSGTPKEATYMSTWMQDTLNRLQNLPLLTICLVSGPTLGGGAEISVACDYIIATDTVKYGFVHGKMGIITAWGGTTRLVNKVGEKKALDLLVTGKILSAEECRKYEIADHVVPSTNSIDSVLEWIEERMRYHSDVIRGFKSTVRKTCLHGMGAGLKRERELISVMWGSSLNKAALLKKINHISKI